MKFKLMTITIILIFLTGCVSYKAVGKFENYNEVFVGNVNANLMTGGGKFDITAVNSNINCSGVALPPDKRPLSGMIDCSGQEGNASGTCSDGRSLSMRYYAANSCIRGYGKGSTADGIGFQFAFGMSQEEALSILDTLANEVKDKSAYPAGQNKQTENTELKNEDVDAKTKEAEDKCKKIGLKTKTEKFNKCVLENSR